MCREPRLNNLRLSKKDSLIQKIQTERDISFTWIVNPFFAPHDRVKAKTRGSELDQVGLSRILTASIMQFGMFKMSSLRAFQYMSDLLGHDFPKFYYDYYYHFGRHVAYHRGWEGNNRSQSLVDILMQYSMHAVCASQAIYLRWEASDIPFSVAASRNYFLFFLLMMMSVASGRARVHAVASCARSRAWRLVLVRH